MVGVAAERELEYLHAGEAQLIAQLLYVGRNYAQILGDDRESSQRITHRLEQRCAWAGHPAAIDGSFLAGRHLPVGHEAAEVIQPRDIDQCQCRAEALDPPAVALAGQHIPAIQRVAPQLPGEAEVIRWYAGHSDRMAFLVQREDLAVGPDIRAIIGYEDRDVADDLDAALVGVALQARPLAKELVLHVGMKLGLRTQPAAPFANSGWLAARDLGCPGIPVCATMLLFQRGEQRVVGQPDALLSAKAGQLRALHIGSHTLEAIE